jgi:hypothetical protein
MMVEVIGTLGGAQPGFGYLHDRHLADAHRAHVVAIVEFEIACLPSAPAAHRSRDRGGSASPRRPDPTNRIGEVLGELGVRLLVREYLAEVAQPDRETGGVIEPVTQRQPLLAGDLVKAAPVRLVLKAVQRTSTRGEYLLIARPDVGQLRVGQRRSCPRAESVHRPTVRSGCLRLAAHACPSGSCVSARILESIAALLGTPARLTGLSPALAGRFTDALLTDLRKIHERVPPDRTSF